eukprot:PhF_6_TR697/c0_g2_i6/m.1130
MTMFIARGTQQSKTVLTSAGPQLAVIAVKQSCVFLLYPRKERTAEIKYVALLGVEEGTNAERPCHDDLDKAEDGDNDGFTELLSECVHFNDVWRFSMDRSELITRKVKVMARP